MVWHVLHAHGHLVHAICKVTFMRQWRISAHTKKPMHVLRNTGNGQSCVIQLSRVAVVVRYRGMKVSNMKQIDAYCEVRYGTQVFRTPCVRGSGNPAWNWQCEVKLEARQGGCAPGGQGECK